MALIAMRQTFTWRDLKGNTARTAIYVADDNVGASFPNAAQGDAHQILNDMAAISNAAVQATHGPYTQADGIVVYGNNAEFPNSTDKVVLFFGDAFGGKHRYTVPAPILAIFNTDGETVNNNNALVKQLVADMLNAAYKGTNPSVGITHGARTEGDQALVQYLGGYRQRKRMPRRTSIQVLTPDLGGPEE